TPCSSSARWPWASRCGGTRARPARPWRRDFFPLARRHDDPHSLRLRRPPGPGLRTPAAGGRRVPEPGRPAARGGAGRARPGRPLLTRTDRTTGAPVAGAEVRLEGNMPPPGMQPILATAAEVAPGKYEAPLAFTMAGDWFILFEGTLADGRPLHRQVDVAGVR